MEWNLHGRLSGSHFAKLEERFGGEIGRNQTAQTSVTGARVSLEEARLISRFPCFDD
jgi:hypothetical protein